jgi:energy-coupling factor transporter ATP-binding protein EcfA2
MSFESGSHWRRWNPHLHAPGTLINDQFADDWEGYLTAIENAAPTVEALGVTDYLSIECYKAVRAKKAEGRLPNVKLIFPNVEFRMTVETDKVRGINLHLLFCPDDADHVERIERALSALTFEYKGSPYRCNLAELGLLGEAHHNGAIHGIAARGVGANQFKVTLDQFRKMVRNDKWVAENCLVAVASSNNDGTAGLRHDASFAALRQEIESFAHIIFSSNAKTREFWLGRSASDDLKSLEEKYGGRKPCLHGCDAHTVAKTCKPIDNRYCWIKGDPSFESLRQGLLEPDERVWIGEYAPTRHDASQCIAQVATHKTPWISNAHVPLNSGLVAIIGSRGSGKTALADILAIGSSDTSPIQLPTSFIHRASNPTNHIGEAVIDLHWGDGTTLARWMNKPTKDAGPEMVRYLSQQFVEKLCSAAGLAVELRREIERVIFDSTDHSDRCDAGTFEELAAIHLNPIRRNRQVAQEAIKNTSAQVNAEEALHARIPTITREQTERAARIEKIIVEMKQLIPTDKGAHATALATLETALTKMNGVIERLNRSKLRVEDLRKEVENTRKMVAPQALQKLKESFADAGLSEEQWKSFEMVFEGDVDRILDTRNAVILEQVKAITDGTGVLVDITTEPPDKWPQKTLTAERDKAKIQVGLDGQKQLRYNQLQVQLSAETKAQEKSTEELTNANGADARRLALVERRKKLYVEVFQSFLDEKQVLESLYAPLQETLKGATGSLKRLRLSVSREIDLPKWIQAGEQLLDLRRDSDLRGHGALGTHVEGLLTPAWQTGTAEEVGEAMQKFIKQIYPEIQKAMPPTVTTDKKAAWFQQVATWFYSTEHIEMRYSITYDGVAIEQLSPGTRGIVLLLLYLVIDSQDRRPLVIDQPEENLDPKSVFEELVPHFRNARKRRQVIIVTHNANLVVNTDADQVIVASSEPNASGGLPTVTYRCGSLENSKIRSLVCEILEGGEQAFLDRERRYRLQRLATPEE